MPEGHTLHRLALEHRAALAGRRIAVSSPQGRFEEAAALLSGTRFEDAEAYGKHLFHWWAGERIVHVHLGLYGKFVPGPTGLQVRMRLARRGYVTDLIGATRCALVTPADRDAVIARLGPDPLRSDAEPEQAWARITRSKAPIGKLLMDQRVLAGVGNVFRAEVLHVHRIHPDVPGLRIGRDQFDAMWAWLVAALQRGVAEGTITTRPDGGDLARWIYKQEACQACGGPVRRWDMAGRWAYACESCQREPRARRPRPAS